MTPKVRQLLYVFGVVVFAMLTVASTFKVIDPNVAASVSAAVTAVLGLFGVTVAGTAAYNTNKQINNGTFEQTPELAPEDKIITGLNEVLKQKANADAAVEKVKEIVVSQTKDIPIFGPLSQQILDKLT